MSVRCITTVLDHSQHAGTELLMLVVLADYSDDDGNSYPSVAALARKCRMGPRNANYILNALQGSGELRVMKNDGPRGTNRYRIMLAHLARQPLHRSAPLQAGSPLKQSSPTPAMECAKPLQPIADEPSLNRQEPSRGARKRAPKFDAGAIELPDWLPRAAWADWVADRVERRKPISSRAAAMQLKRLAALRDDGHDPVAVIGHSITNGYQGLFPPKDAGHGNQVRASGRPVLAADEVFTGSTT